MKKTIIICGIILLTATQVLAFDKTKCTNAKGRIYTGGDGKTDYCVSSQPMNWWSAFAWCKSVGGELIDYKQECWKAEPNGKVCPQLTPFVTTPVTQDVWTKNPASATHSYYVGYPGGNTIYKAQQRIAELFAACL